MIGAQTIGNATIVAYDKNPILSTDPWLGSDHYAYFGSWYLPYEIPEKIPSEKSLKPPRGAPSLNFILKSANFLHVSKYRK